MTTHTLRTRVRAAGRRAGGTWTVTAISADGPSRTVTAPTLAEALRRLPHGGPR